MGRKTVAKSLERVVGFEHEYLSATDPEEYQDRVQLNNLTQDEKRKYLLRLWRTCFNCAFGVGIFLSQMESLVAKITIFGRQMVAQQGSQNIRLDTKPGWYIIMPT